MLVGCLALFELCQRCRAHWETNINVWSLGVGLLPTLSLCEKHCKTGDVFQSCPKQLLVLIATPNIVYIDYIYNILFLNNITNMLIILTMTTTS